MQFNVIPRVFFYMNNILLIYVHILKYVYYNFKLRLHIYQIPDTGVNILCIDIVHIISIEIKHFNTFQT